MKSSRESGWKIPMNVAGGVQEKGQEGADTKEGQPPARSSVWLPSWKR